MGFAKLQDDNEALQVVWCPGWLGSSGRQAWGSGGLDCMLSRARLDVKCNKEMFLIRVGQIDAYNSHGRCSQQQSY